MENKKSNKWRNIITLTVVVLTFLLIFYLASSGNSGEYLTRNEAQEWIKRGEIVEVYAQNGIAKMRKRTDGVDEKKFPNYADFYFEFTSWSQLDFIDEYNNELYNKLTAEGEGAITEQQYNDQKVSFSVANPTASFIEVITPYVTIIVMIVIGVMLFKLFSNKGGGVNTFGKSHARLVEKSTIKFDNIAGAEEEKEETKEIVEFLKNPAKFKNLGARIPKGVLLVGNPGTGKTLLAKAVAGESNVPFLSISGSDFVELYVGVGASRVRDLFATAKKNAPCIVFIDEIDAVGRQRGAGLGGGNDEREQTLNQLLVEMDGFESNDGVIVLAATNRADVLDPALLRPGRFDRQIYVNAPDVKGREGIIKIHAKNKPIASDVDFRAIARLTSGFTGADIENFLNEAAILAARKGSSIITMEDITEGINKVMMGPQKKSRLVTEKERLLTAYHESGHTILAKMLDTGETVHEVSIIPRGMAGGYTQTRPKDDDNLYPYKQLCNRLSMMMGGRIAEQIQFNDITPGASADIQQATKLARTMITEWGMSDKLGFINYAKGSEVFLGRDYQTQVSYSEATAAQIDAEIKKLLDDSYEKAYKTLSDNKDKLDAMAKLLLERETIYTQEVDDIMAGKDYADIIKRINKEEKARKVKEEKKRKEQELLQARKMQELKEQAAIALNNAGVISAQELENIKAESRKLRDETDKQLAPKRKAQPKPKAQPIAEDKETKSAPEAKSEHKPEAKDAQKPEAKQNKDSTQTNNDKEDK